MLHLYWYLQNLTASRPWKTEDGVTALEYGLIAALIAVAIIAGVTFLGGSLNNMFQQIGSTVSSHPG